MQNLHHRLGSRQLTDILQGLDECHGIPSHSTPPRMLRLPGLLVTPKLRPHIVISMTEEPRRGVIGMFGRGHKLIDNIGYAQRALHRILRHDVAHHILGIERFAHVDTIEPHLLRITLLMPEAAISDAWLVLQLQEERIHHLAITLLARAFIEFKERTSRADVVDIILLASIAPHRAVGLHNRIVVTLGIGIKIGAIIHLGRLHHRQQFQARRIVPTHHSRGHKINQSRGRVAHDFALDHTNRQRLIAINKRMFRGTASHQQCTCQQYQKCFFHRFHCLKTAYMEFFDIGIRLFTRELFRPLHAFSRRSALTF